MLLCPRCGEPVEPGQEYCLTCGGRLPGRGTAPGVREGASWILRAAGALAVAAVGAALAIVASSGDAGTNRMLTATGGFATVPSAGGQTETPSARATGWPGTQDGWTIVLASVPQTEGRRVAAARAQAARRNGLRQVGILDSSSYASLRPGYWVVFTGIYGSEAEATSELARAKRFAREATVRRIVR